MVPLPGLAEQRPFLPPERGEVGRSYVLLALAFREGEQRHVLHTGEALVASDERGADRLHHR